MAITLNQSIDEFNTLSMAEVEKNYKEMADRLEKRRETCRKSSKQYYHKTYKLKNEPSIQQIQKNKEQISKRDIYQKTYYEKNKDMIKQKQREYRAKKRADKIAEKAKASEELSVA
tara:strand:- start:12898 stop:13245 length:348 start_codon:yes stop_codon:yes gene_type:complete